MHEERRYHLAVKVLSRQCKEWSTSGAKCLKGAGLWTKGKTKHVRGFYKKKKDGTQSPSSNLAAMSGLQFVDGTLAAGIGFLGKY